MSVALLLQLGEFTVFGLVGMKKQVRLHTNRYAYFFSFTLKHLL